MVKLKDFGTKKFIFLIVLGSSHIITNIDGYWRLTWSLTSESIRMDRDAHKLILTSCLNK
jgi:hypothetical protein